MSTFLSAEELRELTGSNRRKRQIAWLTEHGWRFTTNYRGLPIVARDEVQAQLVTGKETGRESAIRWGEMRGRKKAA